MQDDAEQQRVGAYCVEGVQAVGGLHSRSPRPSLRHRVASEIVAEPGVVRHPNGARGVGAVRLSARPASPAVSGLRTRNAQATANKRDDRAAEEGRANAAGQRFDGRGARRPTSRAVCAVINATNNATPAAPATCCSEPKHRTAVRIELRPHRRQAHGEQWRK